MRNPRTPGSTLGGPGSNLPAPGSNLPAPGSNLPAPGSNMAADRLASQSPSVNRVKSIEEVKPEPRHIESHASLVRNYPHHVSPSTSSLSPKMWRVWRSPALLVARSCVDKHSVGRSVSWRAMHLHRRLFLISVDCWWNMFLIAG